MPQLINANNGDVLLDQLEIADTFWKRLKGLQFRSALPPSSGLLLSPCSSLHTCFMRFPIDVLMLDVNRVVIGTRSGIQPWRTVLCESGTKQVIEINPHALNVPAGTQLNWFNELSTS